MYHSYTMHCIYVSPKATYGILLQQFDNIMRTLDYDHIIIVGDFNMKSITQTTHYNEKLIQYMANEYILQEYVESNKTSYQSKLDLCFSNKTLSIH